VKTNIIFSVLLAVACVSCSQANKAKTQTAGIDKNDPLNTANPPGAPAAPPKQDSNLFPVKIKGKYGYIDKEGKVIIQPAFAMAQMFTEGVGLVRDLNKGGWGFIDKTGNYVIKPEYGQASPFADGMAIVSVGGKIGAIDHNGKIYVKAEYETVTDFSSGLAGAVTKKIAGGYEVMDGGYINKLGNFVIPAQFDGIGMFSENLAAVRRFGQRWSYIDPDGKTVLPAKYENAGRFVSGLAAVEVSTAQGYRWGFIDKTGKMAIQPKYVKARVFSEGLAGVQTASGKWGYIDVEGKLLIPDKFEGVEHFSEGLAQVIVNKKMAYIDKSGKYVWGPKD
jgi:hypothetical protein